MISVGIDAMAIAVPRAYLELADLAKARGVDPAKYVKGLGVTRMAIAASHEDPVTLAVDAARRLFARSGRSGAEVGYCAVGTETAVDHSKPIASYAHGLLDLPRQCRVFETKHACFGATAALLGAVEWIASGASRGRTALVIATDIARYEIGSPGEPTQGAGAVAMLVSENPRLLALEVGRSGSYARDVHDFWRPLHRKDALVDGQFSVSCYLDALEGAYEDWKAQGGPSDETPARFLYHVPYGKMAAKAHRRRCELDGIEAPAADAIYASEVEPALAFSSQVGNIYTGSLYLALASLLSGEAAGLEGRRLGLFSYGSGCGAALFAGRVVPGAGDFAARLALGAPLAEGARAPLSVDDYETLRRSEYLPDRQAPSERPSANGAASFLGVDSGERRVYSGTSHSTHP